MENAGLKRLQAEEVLKVARGVKRYPRSRSVRRCSGIARWLLSRSAELASWWSCTLCPCVSGKDVGQKYSAEDPSD